jgi:alpha-beta hydrolase superfamily lysophospholipase
MFTFFPDNYTWTFRINCTINEGYLGGGNYSEIMQVTEKLSPKEPESWTREWVTMADKIRGLAEEAEAQGLTLIGRERFLRATNYYRNGEFFLPHTDARRMGIYLKSLDCFQHGIKSMAHIKPVKVPYEKSFLPGYFINASRAGEKRPVLVMFGGLDSTAEQLFFMLGRAFPQWGLSALIVDGPGQGGALRLNRILTRYDYEVPARAAYDFLLGRTDVDQKRVALIALSMGGYYAPRAVAFEKRYAACIVWAPEYDCYEFWAKRPDNYPLGVHLMWVLGVDNMTDARKKLKEFNLREVAPLIECPTLVLHGENDQQVPVSHATRTYEALRCPKKLRIFTKEEGGDQHCQGDNLPLCQDEIFAWLSSTLPPDPVS